MRYNPPSNGTANWEQCGPMSAAALENAAREMKAGGKRRGAGRKPRAIPRETVSVKIEPEHAEKFRAICKARGKSQSEQITEWINRARL